MTIRTALAVTALAVAALAVPAGAAAAVGDITRDSVDSAGAQASGGSSFNPSVSADGRFVAFASGATNLVAGDTNGSFDVFVRDRVAGTTTRVSLDGAGAQANGNSFTPSISADGRFVAFTSDATNLVAGDTNALPDVFVRDRIAGATTRVSLDGAGVGANLGSFSPSISADGRFVAFHSNATNLVAGDTNAASDVFVRDRVAGATTRVSLDGAGVQASGGGSFIPSISADGRFVAFSSDATTLVAGDSNAATDVFVRDRVAGATTRVSLDSAGAQASGGNSFSASISADGRFVAFDSDATNLVAGDTNAARDVFVRDRLSATTTRVSLDDAGLQANLGSFSPSISADGRFVAFDSDATNLVAGDTNARTDVFVRDRSAATTTRVSVNSAGAQASGGNSFAASVSGDGRFVAFESDATNLVVGDTNAASDVFTKEFRAEPAVPPPTDPAAPVTPAAPARDTTKPVISGLRVVTAAAAKKTATFTLSEAAKVTLTYTRKTRGRRVKGRCKAGARQGKKCSLYKALTKQSVQAKQGKNTVTLPKKAQKPGSYRVKASAVDAAGNVSAAVTKSFRVPKPKR